MGWGELDGIDVDSSEPALPIATTHVQWLSWAGLSLERVPLSSRGFRDAHARLDVAK